MGRLNLLTGDVGDDMVEKIMDVYNSHEEEYVFYLATQGGSDYLGDIIIDLFSLHEQCTTLIITGMVESKGFDIFFRSKCHKIIMPNTFGVAHKLGMECMFNSNGPTNPSAKFIKNMLESDDEKSYKYYKDLGFTKAELKKFSEGEDVYLDYNRMKELLHNQTKSE